MIIKNMENSTKKKKKKKKKVMGVSGGVGWGSYSKFCLLHRLGPGI